MLFGSTGHWQVFWRHVVWPIGCFGGGGHVNVGVSIVGCVYLVAFAQALDDIQVGACCFHEAVFKQPSVRLRVGVSLSQHVFQGGLEVTHTGQHRKLKQKEDMSVIFSDQIFCLEYSHYKVQWKIVLRFQSKCDENYCS